MRRSARSSPGTGRGVRGTGRGVRDADDVVATGKETN